MPILSRCTVPGCSTLTIGPRCLDHDLRVAAPSKRDTAKQLSTGERRTPALTTR
jgi:hypothetical protein